MVSLGLLSLIKHSLPLKSVGNHPFTGLVAGFSGYQALTAWEVPTKVHRSRDEGYRAFPKW
jgi:hypothetical protein